MARLYANENFPLAVVVRLRELGHDVLTTLDAGKANQAIKDAEVLRFAASEGRAVLTLNRKHFVRLHQTATAHASIVVCTYDPDFPGQAERIYEAIKNVDDLKQKIIRVNRVAD
ncbi:MAG TPA: DUF5615 family PIN-like protein [Terriglobia bacterium]